MATLPTIPTFTDDTAPSIADLNELSQAVSFISDCTVKPLWHFYKANTGAITASTWTGISYGQVAYDNDGVHNASSYATIVTLGYYAVEACIDVAASASEFTLVCAFLWKAGASNPNFSAGTTLRFGARGSDTASDGTADPAICISDICPNICYPGDTIQPEIYATADTTVQVNSNGAFNEGRYVANFTGMWIGIDPSSLLTPVYPSLYAATY